MATSEFKLEPRYIVLKGTDIERYLSATDKLSLEVITRKISVGRAHDNKSELGCVIVESDWQPEYDAAVELVRRSAEAQGNNQLSNEQVE
jgi:hypothetical protein